MKKAETKIKDLTEEINVILSHNDKGISPKIETKINKMIEQDISRHIIISSIVKKHQQLNYTPSSVEGFIYQKIIETKDNKIIKELRNHLPEGLIQLDKSMQINYQPLQELLIEKNFQEADELTQKFLCRLVEEKTNNKKKWLYFTDIHFITKNELFTIDLLWKIYSKGKFGFSIQKYIWIKQNKQWDKLWEKIKWLEANTGIMKRYPQEFTWSLDAPEGHLPLFNQLRGTQTLAYLFQKIDW